MNEPNTSPEQASPPASQPAATATPPPPRRSLLTAALGRLGVLALLGGLAFVLLHRNERTAPISEERGAPSQELLPSQAAPLVEESSTVHRVRFESAPSGASLFVNGRLVGATPLTLDPLAPGAYGIRMEKDGHEPARARVVVGSEPQVCRGRLEPLARGGLEVDVEPRGAEVLLDGELLGVTPLKLDQVRAGPHELLIRKTNFEPYSQRIEILPGQPLVYSEFKLGDKILSMLVRQRDAEDYRIGHRIDLAHYYFITDRFDEAVETFVQALELAEEKEPRFPPEMDPEEARLERRLRSEDRGRLKKEIDKHRNAGLWGEKKTRAFREKFEAAQEFLIRKNAGSWTWVEAAARERGQSGDFAKAESLYLEFLNQNNPGPQTLACLLELLKARVALGEIRNIEATAQKLFQLAAGRPDLLLDLGQALANKRERVRPNDREKLLELAEKAFRRGYELSKVNSLKSECAYELAGVLTAQKHPGVAVEYFKQGVAGAATEEIKEERNHGLAEALRQAGQPEEARILFLKLTQSKSAQIRERAKAGLVMLPPVPPQK